MPLIGINHPAVITKSAEIDMYRQSKHPTLSLSQGDSAHSIADNDIWIAATAFVVRVALITIDNDFTFLRGVFLDVIYLDQKQFFNNNISKSQG